MTIFEGKDDFENGVIGSIRIGLTSIGFEESLRRHKGLPIGDDKDDPIYDFEEGFKYKFNTFYLASCFFASTVLENNPRYHNKINSESAKTLYREICKQIVQRIKLREKQFPEVLNEYLQLEDIRFAFDYIDKKINERTGIYKIILFTDLIGLIEVRRLELGSTNIFEVNEEYLSSIPQIFNLKASENTLENILNPLTKEKLKKYTALEFIAEGCHIEKEQSYVFESVLSKLRSIFAYLNVCKFFLEHVKDGKIEFKTQKLDGMVFGQNYPSGYQKYYIHKKEDASSIMIVDTRFSNFKFSKQKLVIDNSIFEQLQSRCNLEQFNKVVENSLDTEVAKKILRSLDWYLKGKNEQDETDSVLDHFIAIETLLSTGELGLNTKLICENIAMMTSWETEERIKKTREFSQLFKWRNAIFHHGASYSDNNNAWKDLRLLETGLIWTLMGILQRYDSIISYGKDANSINEYFTRLKLSPKLLP